MSYISPIGDLTVYYKFEMLLPSRELGTQHLKSQTSEQLFGGESTCVYMDSELEGSEFTSFSYYSLSAEAPFTLQRSGSSWLKPQFPGLRAGLVSDHFWPRGL